MSQPSIILKAKLDKSDLTQEKVNKQFKNLNINLKAKIDLSEESVARFRKDVEKLSKAVKLNLQVEVDKKSFTEAEKITKDATKKIIKNTNQNPSNKIKIFDKEKLEDDGRQFFISSTNIVNRVKKQFSGLGDVNVSVFKNSKKQVTGFIAEIKKADGIIEKLHFDMAKIKTENSTQKGFVYTGSNLSDKNAGDNTQKALDKLQLYNNKLAKLNADFTSPKSGVQTTEYLDNLNKKYKSLDGLINKLKTSNENLSNEQRRNIIQQISDLEIEIKKYKDLEAVKKSSSKSSSTSSSNDINTSDAQKIEQKIQKINNSLARLKVNKDKVFADSRVSTEVNKLKEMETAYRKGAVSAKEYSLQMDNVRTKTAQVSGELRNVNKDGYSFIQMTSLAAKKIAVWGISTGIVYGALRELKSGISYITDLDNALNQIRIVTGKTKQEVDKLAQSYNDLAKSMSVSTKEVTEQAVDLYRQGLQGEELDQRMDAIIKYAKISSISLEESNRIITATMNATGESAQKVVDTFSYLGRQNCPLVA